MKALLSFLAVTLLNSVFLYPLFYLSVGRKVSWLLIVAMGVGGILCLYLRVKYRKQL